MLACFSKTKTLDIYTVIIRSDIDVDIMYWELKKSMKDLYMQSFNK